MKKIIASLLVVFSLGSVWAQDGSQKNKKNPNQLQPLVVESKFATGAPVVEEKPKQQPKCVKDKDGNIQCGNNNRPVDNLTLPPPIKN
jgi:hypothetical protein